jgi:hypothetical protein
MYLPAGHAKHEADAHCDVALQVTQLLVAAPVALLNVFVAHKMPTDKPVLEQYEPMGHVTGADAPNGQKLPMVHVVPAATPAAQDDPAGQITGAVSPVTPQKKPAVQDVATLRPVVGQKLVVVHGIAAVAPTGQVDPAGQMVPTDNPVPVQYLRGYRAHNFQQEKTKSKVS